MPGFVESNRKERVSSQAQPARPFGVGVIGAGAILRRHALACLSLPEHARLAAVADIDRERAEAGRRLYGFAAACQDYRELLARDDVDVVTIGTRPNLHAEPLIEAIGRGKHVLCEKPIAHTLAAADEIIAACDRHPEARVSCIYQWRSDPTVRWFHDLVERESLGRLLLASVRLRAWRPDAYYQTAGPRESFAVDGGGVLVVIGIHQLDLLVSLLGEPVEVSARMETGVKASEGEDVLVAWVRFRSGVLATVAASVCDPENRFTVELVGERGAARLHGGGDINVCRWEVDAPDATTRRALRAEGRSRSPARRTDPGPLAMRALERVSRLRGRPWLPPQQWWHTPFFRDYLEALRTGEPTPVPPREARRSLELTTAIYQSALTRSEVRLPLDASSPFYAGVEAKDLHRAGGES